MVSGQIGILAAIVIYLVAMVYVGFYFSKQGSGDSADDFYLGGRKLGPLCNCHERGSIRHEQLALNGTAGRGLPLRYR